MTARFTIGIDLGTTNSVVAYAELPELESKRPGSSGPGSSGPGSGGPVSSGPGSGGPGSSGPGSKGHPAIELLPIPQLVGPGQIEPRTSLPSFLYLPRDSERESLRFPLVEDPELGVAGHHARAQAAENPQRVVVAAKSWLCHGKVGRTEAVLPWQSPAEVPKVSAFDCTKRFLTHLVAAWQDAHPDAAIGEQVVVLTVPASFDPAARELTRRAAVEAGLPEQFLLLEEPQAAVYRWLAGHPDRWRDSLTAGDVLLVVDVGGGTTDLTLVTVDEEEGELQLRRLAVGNHLLLGGDNMDLALAHHVSERLREEGHDLDPWQSVSLWHACRDAKEALLNDGGPDEQTISVLGRGSSLIGGTISTKLARDETRALVVDGFFPKCDASARPQRQLGSGFQDIGLPYEADPAITKQVAAFLHDHGSAAELGSDRGGDGAGGAGTGDEGTGDEGTEDDGRVRPTHLLFNGGVFRSAALQDRMRTVIDGWCAEPPGVLGGESDLDSAVAIGAAYYGWSKRAGGIRIRGGTARSYYIGIETAGLAIPGAPRPLRALCVASQGMEEGTEAAVPGEEVGLVVGSPARFRFFSSTVRADDAVGTKIDRWAEGELVESQPIELTLESEAAGDDPFVPVRFVSRVTELGMFELWCHSVRNEDRWKMEFNVRDR